MLGQNADTPIWTSPKIPNGGNCFAVVEFFATAGAAICVALSTNHILFPPSGDPCFPADGSHPRGWWRYSGAFVTGGALIDGCACTPVPPAQSADQFAIADKLGPDTALLHTQGSAIDPDGTPNGNRGLYGVNLQCGFQVINKCDVDCQCRCWLVPQNTGAPFIGAAQVFDNGDANALGVLPIQHGSSLNCAYLNTGGPIPILARTDLPVDKFFRIAVGGGATTPVNFVGSTLPI